MNTKIAALALLLMAGTAPAAYAQDHQDRGDGGPHPRQDQSGGERPAMHDGGGRRFETPRHAPNVAPAPANAPQARAAPAAPTPRAFEPGGRWGGDPRMTAGPRPAPGPSAAPPRQDAPRRWTAPGAQPPRAGNNDGRDFVRRPGRWVDTEGDDTSQGLSPADRADQEDRQELRDSRRFNGERDRQPGASRPDGRRPDGWSRDGVRGPDGQPRDTRNWDRDHRGDHPRDGHGRPEWRPGAFPHSYHSDHRFHVRPYRRPPHFFVHLWSFGEFLPPAWYDEEYLIGDWWDYDLPAPPPGYDWVRVGDDALLIDEYSGRIVQVVRNLFW